MSDPWAVLDRLDPFDIYRWLLAIVGGSYTVVTTASSISQTVSNLYNIGQRGALVRRYVFVQLLRVKLRRLAFDLMQIGVLCVILAYLLWLHGQWRVFEL